MPGTDDVRAAFAALEDARPEYARAKTYFDGDAAEIFASDKVARLLAQTAAHELARFNFARIPVVAVTKRLRLASVTTGDKDADEAVIELIKRNQLKQELRGLHTLTGSQGDAYLMVWPQADKDGNVEDVDMLVHGPGTVRALYDPEHPLRIAVVIKSWRVGVGKSQYTRADLYYPAKGSERDRIERWIWRGKWSAKQDKWEHYEDDGQPWKIEHDWGMPWFHYRTDRPYGRPEHHDAYGPQDVINKIVVGHVSGIDFQTLPQRYGLIDPALDQAGQQSDFDPDHPEDGEADPEDPDNESQLRNHPGEFWQLYGYRAVGEFQPPDPDIFLKPFDRYIKAMAQLTETPMHIFDSTGDRLSGESRREANGPLLAKVQTRMDDLGDTHTEAFAHALALLGFEGVEVRVAWLPPEQINDAEGWETVKKKIDAGVPREVALIDAGFQPEVVQGWLASIDDDAELQRRVELLSTLGEAVQRLGQGVALGAITDKQVAELLDGILAATERTNAEAPDGT